MLPSNNAIFLFFFSWAASIHKGSKAYTITSGVTAIQTEIMTNGPVETAFEGMIYACTHMHTHTHTHSRTHAMLEELQSEIMTYFKDTHKNIALHN